MKTPYKNIYDILKLNRFIILTVVIGAVLTCIVSVLMVIKLHKETVNNAFVVNSDGSVIPLKLVSQRENLNVEALAHLELFHTYFYNIDASNYERNLEKALWLGRTTFEINRGSITDTYELITTGNLIKVDRNFPNNTHGLLITAFFEKTLRKINDEQ